LAIFYQKEIHVARPSLYANKLRIVAKRSTSQAHKLIRARWQAGIYAKVQLIAVASVTVLTMSAYGIARWYAFTQRQTPFSLGVTFIPAYARYLGVEPKETLDKLLGIGVRQFRLVSYWDQIEQNRGNYDFSELDWQLQRIAAVDGTVSLSIGLRQPRWPECHQPTWAANIPSEQYNDALRAFIGATVERYKDYEVIISYQLENEALLKNFGECSDFSRERLQDEFALVRSIDPSKPIILSRSNNTPSWQIGDPQPDIAAQSVYRRVWDGTISKRYFSYPMPAWYYGFIAGTQKILRGQTSIIHELQAEPWPPYGQGILATSLDEQNNSFNNGDLTDRVNFARQTGMKQADLWGAEYWYYRMVKLQDPSVWNEAVALFGQTN
jgi:hypothetical protein